MEESAPEQAVVSFSAETINDESKRLSLVKMHNTKESMRSMLSNASKAGRLRSIINLDSSAVRRNLLRATLVISLLTAAGVCAGLAYKELKDSEVRAAEQTFESVAKSALFGAHQITLRKLQGSQVMSTWVSWTVPDAATWPMISIDGYIPVSDSIATLTSSITQSLMAFVEPQQLEGFENHTKQVYRDQNRPETAGESDFGFGVWKPDTNDPPEYEDGRAHDTTGHNNWGGTKEDLAVLMMHNKPGASSLLYNLYSEKDRGTHIDSMTECAKENVGKELRDPCYAVTDILELKMRSGPAALLFQPVYPANDPNSFVGFATASLHWEDVLTATVPDYVSGLTCIISTETTSFTFEVVKGVPVPIGEGDLHDRSYDKYERSQVLNEFTGAKSSATYTLKVYPTDEMFESFSSNSPRKIAIAFVAVISACGALFFLYDFLMRREVNERSMILEMKRRFVRFISHEIRTPLNTVCMGLELLESELSEVETLGTKGSEDDIHFWRNVTLDVKENAAVAVSILNDLLNYDKLEAGTMTLELSKIDIWHLVASTFQQFQIQAINKNVEMSLDAEKPRTTQDIEGDFVDKDCLVVVGDEIRLGQVLRNVLSNALKFVPEKGNVWVSAEYLLLGLPNAAPLMDGKEPACTHPRAGSVRICIRDSGVGLNEQQLSQLFAEGVQFDANKLQHGGGSGLGLNIAKGLVEQHKGAIWAESEGVGHGTSFFIELPLYDVPIDECKVCSDEGKSTASPTSTTIDTTHHSLASPKLILVVEDADSSRKMLIRLLERSGYSCASAANGKEAVEVIQRDMAAMENDVDHVPIDTILMDYEMPILKGPEAAKEIRRLGYEGTIVGVTGNVLGEDVDYFLTQGADTVLSKPVSLARLKESWEKKHA